MDCCKTIRLSPPLWHKDRVWISGLLDEDKRPILNRSKPTAWLNDLQIANLQIIHWKKFAARRLEKESRQVECFLYLPPPDYGQSDFKNILFFDSLGYQIPSSLTQQTYSIVIVELQVQKLISNVKLSTFNATSTFQSNFHC